jgi:hypothetical protein
VGADLPLLLKAAVATVLAISILRGFAGPPAPARHPAITRLMLLAAAALYVGATSTLLGGHEQLAAVLAMMGVEVACACAWLARARDDGGGGGGGGRRGDGGRPLPGGPGIDWEAFDRARMEWERPRTPAPA